MQRSGFGVAAVLKLTGITYRNLDYWARTGLVRSSIKQASGRGSRRVYAFEDLVALRMVRRLRDAGVPLQAIRRAVRYLQGRGDRPLSRFALIADGKRIVTLTDDPKRMIDATGGGQVVIAIDVAPIRRTLQSEVSQLSSPRPLTARVRGRKYAAVLTPDLEAGGFTITVPELPGCISEADTLSEARVMVRDAIEGWLDVAALGSARFRPAVSTR
jgi:DNA-binding transcriptional MerR regulator/predicted RNase H-like HicB family nuclease